ncbi:hypothetical protein QCA50_005448 [Cerrena zonata]|uniref:Uncharacterized protein n=1 Tax=Cerrena zonata TaxID=2478898 RepID=A0AAW0GP83_9APHY
MAILAFAVSANGVSDIVSIVRDVTNLVRMFSGKQKCEERQHFETFLKSFQSTLQFWQTVILDPVYDQAFAPDVKNAIHASLDQCRSHLNAFMQTLESHSFHVSWFPFARCLRRTVEPIQWQFQKEEISKIEEALKEQMGRIQFYLTCAMSSCRTAMPPTPVSHTIIMSDLLDNKSSVPLYSLVSEEAFHQYLLGLPPCAGTDLIKQKKYLVRVKTEDGAHHPIEWSVNPPKGAELQLWGMRRIICPEDLQCARCGIALAKRPFGLSACTSCESSLLFVEGHQSPGETVTKKFDTLSERTADHASNLPEHLPDPHLWEFVRNIAIVLPTPLPVGWHLQDDISCSI